MKSQTTELQKTFANHISHKRLYPEHIKKPYYSTFIKQTQREMGKIFERIPHQRRHMIGH